MPEGVGQPRGGADVDQAGARGGDERVDVEDHRQPAQPERRRDRGVRPEVALADRVRPAARQVGGVERADERDLEQEVDQRADQHGADHGAGHVALRVAGLAAHLHGLFEALQREHHAERQRREDPVRPERGEAAARGEVAAVEGDGDEHDDREQRHGGLPDHRGLVGLGQPVHARQVDEREDEHEHHGHDEAAADQRAVLVDHARARCGRGRTAPPRPRSARS